MESFIESANKWNVHPDRQFAYTVERNKTENEWELVFTLSGNPRELSFNVTCPESDGDKWAVWSDNDALLPYLEQIIEYCDSKREKSLEDVLNKIDAAVKEVCDADDCMDNDDYNDSNEDNDDYYDHDEDMMEEEGTKKTDSDEEHETSFFGKGASPYAFQRLSKDLKNMKKEAQQFGIVGNPRGDNLFIWDVQLTGFPEESRLGQDILSFATKFNREPVVYLEMQFPGEYPMAPPFVRVTRPRFKFLTGHVTIGGSICMEMLTRSGWRPTNDIESILVQIRSAIMSDPNARLDANPDREYTEAEARDAFNRMVVRYGWNN